MNNQNMATRYEQSLKPEKHVRHVIDQVPAKLSLHFGRCIATLNSNETRPADLDLHWGPEDLAITQKAESSHPGLPAINQDDERISRDNGPEAIDQDDFENGNDKECSFLSDEEEEIEEQYAADDVVEEVRTFELDPDKFKENELQLTDYAIDESWYNELPEDLGACEVDDEFLPETRISRGQRNRQHAYMLAFEYGWTDHSSLDVLVEILEPSGQAAHTINRLRELIDNGASAEELLLAYHIREHWKESHEFSKHYIAAWERYRTFIITWTDALKLVRLYSDTPDIEEIFLFLERLLDNWSTDANLDTRQSFQQYLNKFLESDSLINCPDLQLDF